MKLRVSFLIVAISSIALQGLSQGPVITSFSQNGFLVCSNLAPNSLAYVEWASSPRGPWKTNWDGLTPTILGPEGALQVSVPMYYRVRGSTNVPGQPPQNMALIPAGTFTMGDSFSEGAYYELPLHTVYVSPFYIDKYEVTKALWDEVYIWATNHGYSFDSNARGKASNHPAHSMTWYEAQKWCNARSEKEGKTPAYYTDVARTVPWRASETFETGRLHINWFSGYRLPTEAEWEKAARGGAPGHRFPWTDAETISHSRANYNVQRASNGTNYWFFDVSPTGGYHPGFSVGGTPYTSPVGYFAPNGYGLYDTAGNVDEWCGDLHASYIASINTQIDPRGHGGDIVVRGGSWAENAYLCRNASRPVEANEHDYRGFRSVLPIAP